MCTWLSQSSCLRIFYIIHYTHLLLDSCYSFDGTLLSYNENLILFHLSLILLLELKVFFLLFLFHFQMLKLCCYLEPLLFADRFWPFHCLYLFQKLLLLLQNHSNKFFLLHFLLLILKGLVLLNDTNCNLEIRNILFYLLLLVLLQYFHHLNK